MVWNVRGKIQKSVELERGARARRTLGLSSDGKKKKKKHLENWCTQNWSSSTEEFLIRNDYHIRQIRRGFNEKCSKF